MSTSDRYRIKAAEFAAMARTDPDPQKQEEYATMAASYLRLAELADQNLRNDVFYEPPAQSSR